MNIRISVIIPSYNPGKCIRKCIKSLQKQTLKNIEIICADGGSADGTAEYLEEISEGASAAVNAGASTAVPGGASVSSCQRITVLSRPDASFGELVNAGIEAASGRFIAIIRPGDWAEPDMLRELYEVSSGMDMVMEGFYLTPSRDSGETLYRLPPRYTAINSFDPLLTFDTSLDQSEIFSINCASGSAIISRDFLKKNSIFFTVIAGSPYHDISFSFKVWACAAHVRLLDKASLHCGWRGSAIRSAVRDSADSSSHKNSGQFTGKISVAEPNASSAILSADLVFEEYREIQYFIREMFAEEPDRIKVLSSIMMRLKYDSYLSCCQTLPLSSCRDFAYKASSEFQEDVERGYVIQKYFPSFDWNTFSTWVYDSESFIDLLKRSHRPSLASRFKKLFKR